MKLECPMHIRNWGALAPDGYYQVRHSSLSTRLRSNEHQDIRRIRGIFRDSREIYKVIALITATNHENNRIS